MRSKFSKIALIAFAVNSALSMAFADIPKNCVEELITLSRSSGFDMQKFMTDLPVAVAKAKARAKLPFGKPKDSDIMDLGMTFGCLKDLPESPSEIASFLEDISIKTASGAVAVAQPQAQPQYEQPQETLQEQYPLQEQYQYPPQQDTEVEQQAKVEYPPQQQCVNMEEQRAKVQQLINDRNFEYIRKESFCLSPTDKKYLYDKNRKKAAAAWATLNFFPGFLLGTSIQQNADIGTGLIWAAIDVVGYTAIILSANTFDEESKNELLRGGILLLGISHIWGLIGPFTYQSDYNESLRSALNVKHYSYSIDPLIIPKNGAPAVGLAFNLRY
jgi:hypothetical protein